MTTTNREFRIPSAGFRGGSIGALCLMLFLGLVAAPVQAVTIANLTTPANPNSTAFMFGGSPTPAFQIGGGANNGEGQLSIVAPYNITAPGSSYDPGSGTTTFTGAYLYLSGLTANGPAFGFPGEDFQYVGPGTFQILASDNSTDLLDGTFSATSEIFGPDGTTTAFTFNAATVYNSGLIWAAASPTAVPLNGSASSNLMLTNGSALTIDGGTGYLSPFTAEGEQIYNAMVFTIVPEPASLALLACGMLGLAGWRASRRRAA